MPRPEIEPITAWSKVWHPNCCATNTPVATWRHFL